MTRPAEPVPRKLHRLRWLLTVWFTLVFATGVVVLVAAVRVSAPEYSPAAGLLWWYASLGVAATAVLGPATWALLGLLLAPVVRVVRAQEAFLGATAHDLRTPLATLSVLLETARRDPAQRDEALSRAARLVSRSGDVVDDMLLRARLTAGVLPVHLRPARLDQLTEAVIVDLATGEPEFGTTADGRTTMVVDIDGHRITMIAGATVALLDPALAERAIANLLHNALRHGHEPGRTALITVTVERDGDRAAVVVADSGPGLRPPIERTGLGLSVVRWVARAHRGSLHLGAGPEPGTRIRLSFPGRVSA